MNTEELENRLQSLTLVNPSDDFKGRTLDAITNQYQHRTQTNPPWSGRLVGILFSFLLLSLALNVYQSTVYPSESRSVADNGQIEADNFIGSPERILTATELNLNNTAFSFLCLVKTSITLDEDTVIGELNGFGEWVVIEVAESFRVQLSVKPLLNWQPIGSLLNGRLTVDLDADIDGRRTLTLNDAGLGPTGLLSGGPFLVYGDVTRPGSTDSLETNIETARSIQDMPAPALFRRPDQISPTAIAMVGMDYPVNPYIYANFRSQIDGNECG